MQSHIKCKLIMAVLGFLPLSAVTQTVLPGVNVTAPRWEERHGGYLISSNFEVDSHMSAVVYPAEPFQKDDILGVRLTQMKEDEYFVLQECISLDCTQAQYGTPRVRSASRRTRQIGYGSRTKVNSSCGCRAFR